MPLHTATTARNAKKGTSTARMITVVFESPSLRVTDWVGNTVEPVPVGTGVNVTLIVTTSAVDNLNAEIPS
jgi:hypothetical protein